MGIQQFYGTGLRLMELMKLRVKDIDFGYSQILVRDGKGGKDRITILPDPLDPIKSQLDKARAIYEDDRNHNTPGVMLPKALERKYPNAPKEWK